MSTTVTLQTGSKTVSLWSRDTQGDEAVETQQPEALVMDAHDVRKAEETHTKLCRFASVLSGLYDSQDVTGQGSKDFKSWEERLLPSMYALNKELPSDWQYPYFSPDIYEQIIEEAEGETANTWKLRWPKSWRDYCSASDKYDLFLQSCHNIIKAAAQDQANYDSIVRERDATLHNINQTYDVVLKRLRDPNQILKMAVLNSAYDSVEEISSHKRQNIPRTYTNYLEDALQWISCMLDKPPIWSDRNNEEQVLQTVHSFVASADHVRAWLARTPVKESQAVWQRHKQRSAASKGKKFLINKDPLLSWIMTAELANKFDNEPAAPDCAFR